MTITLTSEDQRFAETQARELGYHDAQQYIHHLLEEKRSQRHEPKERESIRKAIGWIEETRDQRPSVPVDELIEMRHEGHRY